MDTTIQPKMKPVQIQTVSDEIRDLRKGDVDLQQTVLSARAVADIFRGDTINKTNGRDVEYYEGDTVNLDLIIDSGCRHIEEGSYINGPKYAVREEETGDKTPLGGLLYTMGVLPSGELLWGAQEFPKTREEIEISLNNPQINGESRREFELPVGSPIRQLFYVANDELDEPQAYTRIGSYETYQTVSGETAFRYRWGAWVSLNGETQYIVVTDARMEEVVNPIVNSVYSVHTAIPYFYLPDADQQKHGSSIRIIQHPDPNEDDRTLWATNVIYIKGEEGDADYEKMQLTCTPAPRRNTVKTEEAYKEGLVPTEYTFEVAPRMDDANNDPTIIGKTWHLKVDVDETEFTTGIVELLDAHTELGIEDIIDYTNRKYLQDSGAYANSAFSPLYINRAVLCDGFLKLQISKAQEFNNVNWSLEIKRLDSRNPINFVPTKDVSPLPDKVYFTKEAYSAAEGVFSIAILPDGKFNCTVVYYEINADADVQDLFTISSDGLTPGLPVHYQHKIYRNDIIYVVINPGTNTDTTYDVKDSHIKARGLIFPVLSFIPDPHPNSYMHKSELNKQAFTQALFEMQKDAGQIPADMMPGECPASTGALLEGYKYLASQLQKKGLMFGANKMEVTPDECVETGIYWVDQISDPSQYPYGASLEAGGRLIVYGNEVAHPNTTHENDQYTMVNSLVPEEGVEYFIRDLITGKMKSVGTPSEFYTGIKYYILDPGKVVTSTADVVQVFIQSDDGITVWTRTLKYGSETWSDWAILNGGKIAKSYKSDGYIKTTLSAAQLKSMMSLGELVLHCGMYVSDSRRETCQEIHLPQPEDIPYGKQFALAMEAAMGTKIRVSYTATDEENVRAYVYTQTSSDGAVVMFRLMNDGDHWLYSLDGTTYRRIGG